MSVNLHAWVTFAGDDSYAPRVLVLARSLRRVLTTGKLVLLITRSVSKAMRALLMEEFDLVSLIDTDDPYVRGIHPLVYAKMYCWQLMIFQKCVFLEPELMILKNCDDLFYRNEFSAAASREWPNTFDSSVFVLKPCIKVYNKLFEGLNANESNDVNPNNILNWYFRDWVHSKPEGKHLPLIYNYRVSTENRISFDMTSSIKIVHFDTYKPWAEVSDGKPADSFDYEDTGEQLLFGNMWMEIFATEVYSNLACKKIELEDCLLPESINLNSTNTKIENYGDLNNAVAIVGLSCRTPGANNSLEFWKLLLEGKNLASKPSEDRLKLVNAADPEKWDRVQAGFLKCPVDEFDAKFFGISPREVPYIDPQQRLLLEVAWEGLEDAGINPQTLKGSNSGVFVGIWTTDYEHIVKGRDKSMNDFQRTYLGNTYCATAARISFILGLEGPNIATDSGCSSSLVSLHLAVESLRRRECNLALVGGVNLVLSPYELSGFLSPDGKCKTFDSKADGFGRAEGCGIVVLKRLSDAQRDGDNITAIIRGSAMTQEGTSSSFGTPTAAVQAKCIKESLQISNISPDDISYVEAHGTGTTVGDPVEMEAIGLAYSSTKRKNPLIVGAVKALIGHTEAAAGVIGLIKVLLAMKNECIPPQTGLDVVNPKINLKTIPAVIPIEVMDWKKSDQGVRMAGISSFGMSGTNVHIIVQEPPVLPRAKHLCSINERPQHILALSAHNNESLVELIKVYQNYINCNPQESFADIAFTANTCRAHFGSRIAIVGNNSRQAEDELGKCIQSIGKSQRQKPSIAFLFTGQGSQYVGMARDLYNVHPGFRNTLKSCCKHFEHSLGLSLLEIILGNRVNEYEDKNEVVIDKTLYSQTSIFCIEYSLLMLWKSFGVEPDFVFGHSVGEYVAAIAAGIISFEDGAMLISSRSKLIDGLPNGGMLALRASFESTERLIKNFAVNNSELKIDVAVINSQEETVVAGKIYALSIFADHCSKLGIKTQRIASTHAFHSREMNPILQEFGKVASSISYHFPTCKYVSGGSGKVLAEDYKMTAEYWQEHARKLVNFKESVATLNLSGCKIFIEIGAHPVLLALAMGNLSTDVIQDAIWLPSIRRNEENWATLLNSVAKLYCAGVDIKWKHFEEPFQRNRLKLPTYPFQRQKFWFSENDDMNIARDAKSHPLLGKKLLIPTNDHVFQNNLNLNDLNYLRDHRVAHRIIMPGAGFLEMVLAAGCTVIEDSLKFSDDVSYMVTDFVIEAPLELISDKSRQLQVLASHSDISNLEGSLKISIFQPNNDNDGDGSKENEWKCHASGIFSICSSKSSHGSKFDPQIFTLMSSEFEQSTEELYQRIADIGIQFGPAFRSINRIWYSNQYVLSEVVISKSYTKGDYDYIFHPILLDALIQIFSLQTEYEKSTLQLPIGVKQFTIFKRSSYNSGKYFVRTRINDCNAVNESDRVVTLFDVNGERLAEMKGVRLARTSIPGFLKLLKPRSFSLPGFYEEVWRSLPGPLTSRVNLKNIPNNANLVAKVYDDECFNPSNLAAVCDAKVLANRLSFLYILRAFYQLGWDPVVGEILDSQNFRMNLIISSQHEELLQRYFKFFVEEGLFIQLGNGTINQNTMIEWKLVKLPPSPDEVDEGIANIFKDGESSDGDIELMFTKLCGKDLAPLLQNRLSALSLLFSDDERSDSSALNYYSDAKASILANKAMSIIFEEAFQNVNSNSVLRVLEIGAGTGSSTVRILEALKNSGTPFHYMFTDISPMFLSQAKEKFSEFGNSIEFKLFNVELDPKMQGFYPHQFDAVIAANVLHATEDLKVALRNVRHLLVPCGLFVVLELFDPPRSIDISFALLEGWWRFKDYSLRPNYPIINSKQWTTVLPQVGFESVEIVTSPTQELGVVISRASSDFPVLNVAPKIDSAQQCWLIFHDNHEIVPFILNHLSNSGRNVFLIQKSKRYQKLDDFNYTINPTNPEDCRQLFDSLPRNQDKSNLLEGIMYLWGLYDEKDRINGREETDQRIMCGGLLHICKSLLSETNRSSSKLIVVTNGNVYMGDQKCSNPAPATLGGFIKALNAEQSKIFCQSVDLDPAEVDVSVSSWELYSELWKDDAEFRIVYRQRQRHVCRFIEFKHPPNLLTIPNCERYKLVKPASCAVEDLILGPVTKAEVSNGEVEIEIRATGLNFRDLFVIMRADRYNTLYDEVGMEFSGRITAIGTDVVSFAVGDDVFGISMLGAICSHIVVSTRTIMRKPSNMTHIEAATLPIVYFTAYHCLVSVANIKEKDVVLIHAASGGVGLAAIQIAKDVGAYVIATAGSIRKREYLKSLGIQHVFNSRKTIYGEDIRKATSGRGVDIVLNSLTSPGFKEATLSICKHSARFVEIGKRGIWTVEEVRLLRSDISYTVVDLEKVMLDPVDMQTLVSKLEGATNNGTIQPLPFTRFDVSQCIEAFTYFQKAHHIGKIVITTPKIKYGIGKLEIIENQFNSESTYLITGGLGGLGLEVAKWMISSGAKFIVLVGRRAPDLKAKEIISELNSRGGQVMTLQADIGEESECIKLMKEMQKPNLGFPQLRGIFHSAGILSDGVVMNQNWQTFETVFKPKVKGAWNLHQITKNHNLEFFVLFSSATGCLGNVGQSNHAAANTYLDALAYYRHSLGLPAQSIAWGAWSEVGAAASYKVLPYSLKHFTPSQGIAALRLILRNRYSRVIVITIDDIDEMKALLRNPYLDELHSNIQGSDKEATSAESEKFWDDIKQLTPDEQGQYITKCVEKIARQILKLPDHETFDDHENFSEMGMDSLMAVEMRNRLQSIFGKNITLVATALLDNPTLHSLSSYLTELIAVKSDFNNSDPCHITSHEKLSEKIEFPEEKHFDVAQLVQEDSKLPLNIKDVGGCKKPSGVKNILITGSTGNLGSYIVHKLLQTGGFNIHCLIRAKSDTDAKRRLLQRLKANDTIHSTEDMKQVTCLAGDIVECDFGISRKAYEDLARKIDGVIHSAVRANHLEQYKRNRAHIKTDIRCVNVVGTLNILQFCSTLKTKRLLHTSTLLSATEISVEGELSENLPDMDNQGENLTWGYPLSKFVAEKLVHQAIERGIPSIVLRYPLIGGDSETGLLDFNSNHFVVLLHFCLKLGMIPVFPNGWSMLPVDMAAELSLQIFLNDSMELGAYNMTNPHVTGQEWFLKFAKDNGYPMEVLPFDQWAKNLSDVEENSILAPLRDIYESEETFLAFTNSSPLGASITQGETHVHNVSPKMRKAFYNIEDILPTTSSIIEKHFEYGKKTNIFENFSV